MTARGPWLTVPAIVCALAGSGCGASGSSRAATSASPSSASSLQNAYVQLIRAVGPSVIQIRTPSGLGSGVVYDGSGDIVTNAHVVAGARALEVIAADGKQLPAALVGSFSADDLAVIKVHGAGLPAARFADSSKLNVGEIVLAIGSPLGLRSSVSDGIVSSLGRTVSEGNGVTLPSVIQTSAAINPGNSGGALVNLDQQVIGIPTLAATDPQLGGGSAPGIGFAIPSNTVKTIVPQLIRYGRVQDSGRAYLAIQAATLPSGDGVLVIATIPHGAAAQAGIRAGDVITSIAGHPTPSNDAITGALANLKPDTIVKLEIIRQDGTRTSIPVRLGRLPAN